MVVILKDTYLNKLSKGEYTIIFLFTDGECSAVFKVKEIGSAKVEDTKDDINDTENVSDSSEEIQSKDNIKRNDLAPATGDSCDVIFWSALAVSAACTAIITAFRNKKSRGM